MARVYLGLGSNMGDRRAHLKKALEILENHKDIEVKKVSSLYESEAVGQVPQPNFYNMVAAVETSLSPRELLRTCQAVERDLKRERKMRWGPRTIDADILLYNSKEVREKELTLPHPELKKRAFVLVPLLEIAPNLKLPSGESLEGLLKSGLKNSYPLKVGDLKSK